MYAVIVDMDQPGIRNIVCLSEDEFAAATFDSIEEIEALKQTHPLRVFDWIVVDLECPWESETI